MLNLFQSVVFLYTLFTHHFSFYLNRANYLKYGVIIYISIYYKNTISLDSNFLTLTFCLFDFLLLKAVNTNKPLIRTLTIEFCLFLNNSVDGILVLLQTFTERLVDKIASIGVIAIVYQKVYARQSGRVYIYRYFFRKILSIHFAHLKQKYYIYAPSGAYI